MIKYGLEPTVAADFQINSGTTAKDGCCLIQEGMKKNIGELIDGLSITNNKIFYLVSKVQRDEHTREDAKKIQDLNKLRSEYTNAINKYFKERADIKV